MPGTTGESRLQLVDILQEDFMSGVSVIHETELRADVPIPSPLPAWWWRKALLLKLAVPGGVGPLGARHRWTLSDPLTKQGHLVLILRHERKMLVNNPRTLMQAQVYSLS